MSRTGVVWEPRFADHSTGAGHPERPERIRALLELEPEFADGFVPLAPRPATVEEIARNHDSAHVEAVAATAGKDYHKFDADTRTSADSHATALLAAGTLIDAAFAVADGRLDNAFVKLRPPGHHAERDRAMGFCLFNNVAVAARALMAERGVERVLIVDWDVHHGNGTENSFYDDPRVLYVSLHQYPHYPGTGADGDVGRGAGEGRNVNVPLPAGCGDDQYAMAFERIVEPIARQFDPGFVLVSAGMDCHWRDPLGGMRVTEAGVGAMARRLLRVARETCGGKCVGVLEGGYDLAGLKASTAETLRAFRSAGAPESEAPEPAPTGERPRAIDRVVEIQKRYWEM